MKKPRIRLKPSERAAAAWQRAQSILRKKYGTPDEVAAQLGISRQAVWKFTKVPILQVNRVSVLTGIPPHRLRPDLPDLFPPPKA